MLTINTNLSSLIAQGSMKSSTNKLNQAIERMTTGFKINHAKDNAANYSISTNMTTKIGAYQVAEDNALQGLDMINTASESLTLIEDKLMRLRALAEQSANGTYGAQSKQAINQEANAIVDEIERLYNTTEYNGINLAKGKVIGTEESKFIKDIDRRDTSKMTTLASVAIDEALTSGTYSISTADELAKLATMTNNGLVGASTEFVLANDIDLQAWCNANGSWVPIGNDLTDSYVNATTVFGATFDGNGYIISNLKIENKNSKFNGLFGFIWDANIKNTALENAKITNSGSCSGLLIGYGRANNIIDNCYCTGEINSNSSDNIGGLIGYIQGIEEAQPPAYACVSNCYSDTMVNARYSVGGLAGTAFATSFEGCFSSGSINSRGEYSGAFIANTANTISIEYCYSDVEMLSTRGFRGFIGNVTNFYNCPIILNEVYYYGETTNLTGILVGGLGASNILTIKKSGYSDYYNDKPIPIVNNNGYSFKTENMQVLSLSEKPLLFNNNANIKSYDGSINLQVGINSELESCITLNSNYNIDGLNSLRSLRNFFQDFPGVIYNDIHKRTGDYVAQIDLLIKTVSSKQTELGVVQNRLESALDEISIKYDNLVSSRSTLRDADIAELSSHYIQQQILQQASATLLATANQSPSIALQLI